MTLVWKSSIASVRALSAKDFYFLVVCFSCGEGGGIVVQGGGDVLGLPDEKKSELVERGRGRRRREVEVVGRWRRGSRGVLWEAGSRKGRKKGTITSDRLLLQRRQPSRSFWQNMVAACSKATFVLLSGVIEVTSEGGKRGPSPTPTPTPSTSNPPTRSAPLPNRPHVPAAEVNRHVALLFSPQSPTFEREPLSGSSRQHTERLLHPPFFWQR